MSVLQAILQPPEGRPLRAFLVSNFVEPQLSGCIDELARRGIDVVDDMRCVPHADYTPILTLDPDVVLLMNEVVGHASAHDLLGFCRRHGIAIRMLSRKKASWGFLPSGPPLVTDKPPPTLRPPPPPKEPKSMPPPKLAVVTRAEETVPMSDDHELLKLTMAECDALRKEVARLTKRASVFDAIVHLVEAELLTPNEGWEKLATARGRP